MALDRQSIEKKDFAIGHPGYDPDAVDGHLSALADEIAEFRRSARRRGDALASSASEQVRAIVEAAETSAAGIQRGAESDAREIRDEADRDAQATRDQARDYVAKVAQMTDAMLARLDAIETELGSQFEMLRAGSTRLGDDLRLLEGQLTEIKGTVEPGRAFEPESQGEPGAASGVAAGPEDADRHDDPDGARLIALNMALNGTSRDETARYLSGHFRLSDPAGLLDEVYSSVEG